MSIFLGGGTPSVFSGKSIEKLLAGIKARVELAGDVEITLESNPGAADESRYASFRQAGVNRLSIGIQSFRDSQLRALGRVHDSSAARLAFTRARNAGFENINLDLMFGLPDDTLAGSHADLKTAIDLGPEHISWYQLTLEPGTPFHYRPPALPDEDSLWEMQQRGMSLLVEHRYGQYEVSAFARASAFCRHNLNYWEFGDYLAIGAGAHGKLTDPATGTISRYAKVKQPNQYMQTVGTPAVLQESGQITVPQRISEFMLGALRLSTGFSWDLFESRTGLPRAAIEDRVQLAVRRGLLFANQDSVQTTSLGWRYLNQVVQLFYT